MNERDPSNSSYVLEIITHPWLTLKTYKCSFGLNMLGSYKFSDMEPTDVMFRLPF